MSFTAEDVLRLRDGWRGPITVGEVPQVVAAAMRLCTPLVYLSRGSLAHINVKHPDITDNDLTAAPFVLKHGLVLRETRKEDTYLVSHVGVYCPKRMGLVIKVAKPDREAYMTTYHRVHRRQTIAWLKRCELIKTHD